MPDTARSRSRTALFAALVLLVAVLGWVAFTDGGEIERGTELEAPATADPDTHTEPSRDGRPAEDLPSPDDEDA